MGSVSRAWARVDRYRRLNFAVAACLAVNTTLMISLIGAVEFIDRSSQSALDEAYDHDETSRELLQAARALERLVDGSPAAAADLDEARDRLLARADALGDHHAAKRVELDQALDRIALAIDGDGGEVPITARPEQTIRLLERLADTFVMEAEEEILDVEGRLAGWLGWIQIVAAFFGLLFTLVVITVILPLSRSIERSLLKLQTWRSG